MNFGMNDEIFAPYEKLVKIEICGETAEVPENNWLLRCFQFLAMDSISIGNFCWMGDCANCQVWLESEQTGKPVLACRTKVEAGMKIIAMNDEIVLSDKC